jgi:hypothetical protein
MEKAIRLNEFEPEFNTNYGTDAFCRAALRKEIVREFKELISTLQELKTLLFCPIRLVAFSSYWDLP